MDAGGHCGWARCRRRRPSWCGRGLRILYPPASRGTRSPMPRRIGSSSWMTCCTIAWRRAGWFPGGVRQSWPRSWLRTSPAGPTRSPPRLRPMSGQKPTRGALPCGHTSTRCHAGGGGRIRPVAARPKGRRPVRSDGAQDHRHCEAILRAAERKELILRNPFADHTGDVPANRRPGLLRVGRRSPARAGSLSRRRMAASVRFGAVRWATVSIRDAGAPLGRYRLVPGPHARPQPEDRAPRGPRHTHRADLPGTAAALAGGVRGGRRWGRVGDHALRRRNTESSDPAYEDHQTGRFVALAQALAESPIDRETELAETFPAHVVSAWIGNSIKVAARHYLQVTEEHFSKAAQNPAQYTPAGARTSPQAQKSDTEKTLYLQGNAKGCDSVQQHETAPHGRYRTRTSDFLLVREAL